MGYGMELTGMVVHLQEQKRRCNGTGMGLWKHSRANST